MVRGFRASREVRSDQRISQEIRSRRHLMPIRDSAAAPSGGDPEFTWAIWVTASTNTNRARESPYWRWRCCSPRCRAGYERHSADGTPASRVVTLTIARDFCSATRSDPGTSRPRSTRANMTIHTRCTPGNTAAAVSQAELIGHRARLRWRRYAAPEATLPQRRATVG